MLPIVLLRRIICGAVTREDEEGWVLLFSETRQRQVRLFCWIVHYYTNVRRYFRGL